MKFFVLILALLILISCGKGHDTSSHSLSELEVDRLQLPQIDNSTSGLEWKDTYSKAIVTEILKDENSSILNRSISTKDLDELGCPNLNNMNYEEKISFFIVYLSAIAEAESDFNNFSKSKAPDNTINVGLFQIDKNSAKRHGGIKYKDITNKELEIGEVNSTIAVNILRNQLRDRKNSLLPKYYWEVLYGERGFKNFIRHFNNHLDQLNCGAL